MVGCLSGGLPDRHIAIFSVSVIKRQFSILLKGFLLLHSLCTSIVFLLYFLQRTSWWILLFNLEVVVPSIFAKKMKNYRRITVKIG